MSRFAASCLVGGAVALGLVAAAPECLAPVKSAKGTNAGLCAVYNKAANVDIGGVASVNVCPLCSDQFHYLCGEFTYTEAAAACGLNNWRLAQVNQENAAQVVNLVQQCMQVNETFAWIAGIDGQPADPCAFIANYQGGDEVGAVLNVGIRRCSEMKIGVVCEKAPRVTDVLTETATTSITSGIARTTTTLYTVNGPCDCVKNPCDACFLKEGKDAGAGSEKKSQQGGQVFEKAAIARGHGHHDSGKSEWSEDSNEHCAPCHEECLEFCHPCTTTTINDLAYRHRRHFCKHNHDCKTCPQVCSVRPGEIRVIQANTAPQNAAAECAKYGWTLLDLTDGRQAEVGLLFQQCFGGRYGAWINSYDGVPGDCNWATYNPLYGPIAVGKKVNDGWCTLDNLWYVLCQTNQPYQKGPGKDIGSISQTTTTTTYTSTFVRPTSTQVITSTIFY